MEQLKPVLQENFEKNRELMKSFRKQKRQLYKDLREKAAGILTPEQLKKLDEMEQRHYMKKHNKKFHKHGPRPKSRPGN